MAADEAKWGSATHHKREMRPLPNRRRKCRCGCDGRATHAGTANGIGLMIGCEWTVRRWVHDQDQRALTRAALSGSSGEV